MHLISIMNLLTTDNIQWSSYNVYLWNSSDSRLGEFRFYGFMNYFLVDYFSYSSILLFWGRYLVNTHVRLKLKENWIMYEKISKIHRNKKPNCILESMIQRPPLKCWRKKRAKKNRKSGQLSTGKNMMRECSIFCASTGESPAPGLHALTAVDAAISI